MPKLFTDFLQQHGRVPLTDKGETPWRYRGWLLYYLQCLQEHPRFPFPDRWTYLYKIKNGVDPGPIPKIEFGPPSREALSNLGTCIEIAGEYGKRGWGWASLRVFLEWLAYGLGVTEEEADLDDTIQEKLYRTFNGEEWLRHPWDYIGTYICESRGKAWNPNAFYPTPHNVVECMTLMTFHDIDKSGVDTRFQTVNDCCVGTGRMLLHAGNFSLCLSAMDIDPLMILTTKINGAFYVPWLVCPVEKKESVKKIEPRRNRKGWKMVSLQEVTRGQNSPSYVGAEG